MPAQPLNFGFSNICGLNDPLKQREAKCFVNNNNLSLIGLIEHKIRQGWVDRVMKVVCPNWLFVHNYPQAPLGRILVCWDPSVISLKVLDQSNQFIHCEMQTIADNNLFLATFVYGSNNYLERHDLWRNLQHFKNPTPWVVLGDFNAIRYPNEKFGGLKQWPSHMDNLNNRLYSTELDDLRYLGCFYTWAHKQDSTNFVSTKIDRVLANESWIKTYSCSSAHFFTTGISDHSPAVVYLTPNPKKVIKPFKFFDFLADHPEFLSIVQRVWRKIIIGNPMFCVCEKLKFLQGEFKQPNSKDFSDISSRVVDSRNQLESLQSELSFNPTNTYTLSQERAMYRQYLSLLRTEESLAKQKSRIQWLKLGDQCTSFFFKSVSNLRNKSKITSLVLDDGSTTQDINVIKQVLLTVIPSFLVLPTSHHT